MPAAFRAAFFVALSVAAIVVLLVLLLRRPLPAAYGIALALVLGGTAGNLIDRLARGKVVDFVYFHHDWFSYPVFNLADSAITCGVVLVMAVTMFADSGARARNRGGPRAEKSI